MRLRIVNARHATRRVLRRAFTIVSYEAAELSRQEPTMHRAMNLAEVVEAVKTLPKIHVRAGGTKSAMSAGATLSLEGLSGVLEYEPAEYTFTALAGTKLSEVRDLLAANGQYLPYDPALVDAGGTIGGTIASGLSGPGRFRYGGVRDFLLGVKFVTGEGAVVNGGGKVVKNAAGFDFPKLLVGSRGELGVIVEATFKVFPEPRAYATLRAHVECDAVEHMNRLAGSPLELSCLDYLPPIGREEEFSRKDAETQRALGGTLFLRLGGLQESMPRRIERASQFIGGKLDVLTGDDDAATWRDAREFLWHNEDASTLVKLPIAPNQVRDIERAMDSLEAPVARRYSVGGNVCWLAWPNALGPNRLGNLASQLDRNAIGVRGQRWGLVGPKPGQVFLDRLASVLDPAGKFRRE